MRGFSLIVLITSGITLSPHTQLVYNCKLAPLLTHLHILTASAPSHCRPSESEHALAHELSIPLHLEMFGQGQKAIFCFVFCLTHPQMTFSTVPGEFIFCSEATQAIFSAVFYWNSTLASSYSMACSALHTALESCFSSQLQTPLSPSH